MIHQVRNDSRAIPIGVQSSPASCCPPPPPPYPPPPSLHPCLHAFSCNGIVCLRLDFVRSSQNDRWRLNKYHGWQARFDNTKINGIYNRYAAIAARYGMTLHQLAIAFVNTRWVRCLLQIDRFVSTDADRTEQMTLERHDECIFLYAVPPK